MADYSASYAAELATAGLPGDEAVIPSEAAARTARAVEDKGKARLAAKEKARLDAAAEVARRLNMPHAAAVLGVSLDGASSRDEGYVGPPRIEKPKSRFDDQPPSKRIFSLLKAEHFVDTASSYEAELGAIDTSNLDPEVKNYLDEYKAELLRSQAEFSNAAAPRPGQLPDER